MIHNNSFRFWKNQHTLQHFRKPIDSCKWAPPTSARDLLQEIPSHPLKAWGLFIYPFHVLQTYWNGILPPLILSQSRGQLPLNVPGAVPLSWKHKTNATAVLRIYKVTAPSLSFLGVTTWGTVVGRKLFPLEVRWSCFPLWTAQWAEPGKNHKWVRKSR